MSGRVLCDVSTWDIDGHFKVPLSACLSTVPYMSCIKGMGGFESLALSLSIVQWLACLPLIKGMGGFEPLATSLSTVT